MNLHSRRVLLTLPAATLTSPTPSLGLFRRFPIALSGTLFPLACLPLALFILGCTSTSATTGTVGGGTIPTPATAKPTFSPAPGSYNSTQSVSISSSTSGAAIYYTIDGSTPTTASRLYTGNLTLAANTTISAIATSLGYASSAVATAVYTITQPAEAPTFNPAPGTYQYAQSVTLADASAGTTIYYTTDGSVPTTASTPYTSPVGITGNQTIMAIASGGAFSASPVATARYIITNGKPAYTFTNAQIIGGGYVTGIVAHPAQQGLFYARTDIGGAYRLDANSSRWTPLTDFIGRTNSNLIGIESIGIDPSDARRLYLAVGTYAEPLGSNGAILSSNDQGSTFTASLLPIKLGSNDVGRSAGERLGVDPNLGSKIYFGSRLNGLWQSLDYGATWAQVATFPVQGATGTSADPGVGVIFEQFIQSGGTLPSGATQTVYAGVSDPTIGLYVSKDAGATWSAVPGQPTGYFPNSYAYSPSDGNLYIAYGLQKSCSANCVSVGPYNINAGQLWKYTLPTSANSNGTWTNITPPNPGKYSYGFASIAVDPQNPKTLVATTIDLYYPPPQDDIYRSIDGGITWESLQTRANRDASISPWLLFGATTAGAGNWMNHFTIDPFDSNHALYATGQTIWTSSDLSDADTGTTTSPTSVVASAATNWNIGAVGIEETVALALVSPPSGPAHLLSGVGDIGGFIHTDLSSSPAGGMMTNPTFSNTTGLDFAQGAPLIIARVGSGTQSNTAQFGAYSTDGGLNWTPFPTQPAGVTTGSGAIAVSADGSTFVWIPADGGLPASWSADQGATWTISTGSPNQPFGSAQIAILADRVNPKKFYIYNPSNGAFYVSADAAKSFTVAGTLTNYGNLNVSPAAEGDLWFGSATKLTHSTDSGATFLPIASTNPIPDAVYGLGFGMAAPAGIGTPSAPAGTYPAIYMIGSVSNTPGVYRSIDEGLTWVRINDSAHQYGYWNLITGDPRVFGRAFLGTSSRGIIVADSPF